MPNGMQAFSPQSAFKPFISDKTLVCNMDEYDEFYMKMLLSKLIVLLCKRRTLFFFTSSLVRSVRTAWCQNMSWMPIVLRSTLTSWNILYICVCIICVAICVCTCTLYTQSTIRLQWIEYGLHLPSIAYSAFKIIIILQRWCHTIAFYGNMSNIWETHHYRK